MLCLSRVQQAEREATLALGHLVPLNKPTIDSRLRTGTGGAKRLPPKKTVQIVLMYLASHM